jgi:hypothetical protein
MVGLDFLQEEREVIGFAFMLCGILESLNRRLEAIGLSIPPVLCYLL